MTPVSKIAVAMVMGVACGAWAGVAPMPVDSSPVYVGIDSDPALVSGNRGIEGIDPLVNVSPAPAAGATVSTTSSFPVRQSAGPTVVPLPAAAPAGLLLLGMIGFVGFVRRIRTRLTSPIRSS